MASNLIVLNKIKSTAHIQSIVLPASAYNGYVYVLGTRNSNGTYSVAAPTAVTDEGMVVLLDEDIGYNAEYVSMGDVTFASGEIRRAYHMELGNVISIPQANITATVALGVGKVVVPNAGAAPMECLAAFAGTEVLGFEIEELYTKAGVSMARLRCVRTQK